MPKDGEIWVNTRTTKRYRIVGVAQMVVYTPVNGGGEWMLGVEEFGKRFKKEV